jgi:hypothetical protein
MKTSLKPAPEPERRKTPIEFYLMMGVLLLALVYFALTPFLID